MLGRKLKNSGMTLVEVLVSMFVLSIAAVTVISAFSMAAQVNTKAKRQQSAEALMENMLEYAEAGGEDFQLYFGGDLTPSATPAPGVTPTPEPIKTVELKNVPSGFLEFTIKITTDTEPAKYNSGTSENTWLNDFKVIQFGGSDGAILVDATSADYDNQAAAVFLGFHEEAIIQHDEEELEENEGDDPDLWYGDPSVHKTHPDDVLPTLDREIWIHSQAEGGSKFRLVAYMAYKTNGGIEMPEWLDVTTYSYMIPLCYSEEFDSADSGETNPKYLNQIYVMYAQENELLNNVGGVDVRIWDPSEVLTANLYMVKQATNHKDVVNPVNGELTSDFKNAVKEGDLSDYYTGGAGDLVVSCYAPDTTSDQSPKSIKIYSPSMVKLKDGEYKSSQVTTKSNDLVAEGDKVRAITVTIEIIDEDTGQRVLAPETVTRLQ